MKNYTNTIYSNISQYLLKKGYSPILLKDKENITKMLLFIDYSEKIIFSISVERIKNTLHLCEGSLFDESNLNKGISCGFYCACSIPYSNHINIDNLISQFESSFEQFIIDGKDIKAADNKAVYPGMESGISFENPQNAITEFAKQNNLRIITQQKTNK